MPTLNEHFLALCTSPQEAHSCERRLSSTLLPSSRRAEPLLERLTALEHQLHQRRHLLSDMPTSATLANKMERLEKEAFSAGITTTLSSIGAHAPGTGNEKSTEVDGLRDDAIANALLAASFTMAEKKIDMCDLTTAEGRRKALEISFQSNSILLVRLLARGSKALARRHPLLAKLHTLRPYLSYYFSFCQAVNPATGSVPTRASTWSWTSPTGEDDTSLNAFLKQQYLAINWVDPPHGFNGLQGLLNQARIDSVDKRDHYTVLRVLEQLSDFGGRTFLAFGLPNKLTEEDAGFTWQNFISFYTSHVKRAFQLGSLNEQYDWLAKSDALFRESLRCMGDEVRRTLESSDPAAAQFGAILPGDARPIAEMKTMQARLDLLLENRDAFSMFRPIDSTPAQLDVLPRLSMRNHSKRLRSPARSRSNSPVRGGEANPLKQPGHRKPPPLKPALKNTTAFSADRERHVNDGADPSAERTVPHYHWLVPKKLLFTSGKVWNVDLLAKKLRVKVADKCWQVVLSRRTAANKQSMCEHKSQAGHQSIGAAAHTLGGGVNLGELAKEFSRYPSKPELKKLEAAYSRQNDHKTSDDDIPKKPRTGKKQGKGPPLRQ